MGRQGTDDDSDLAFSWVHFLLPEYPVPIPSTSSLCIKMTKITKNIHCLPIKMKVAMILFFITVHSSGPILAKQKYVSVIQPISIHVISAPDVKACQTIW